MGVHRGIVCLYYHPKTTGFPCIVFISFTKIFFTQYALVGLNLRRRLRNIQCDFMTPHPKCRNNGSHPIMCILSHPFQPIHLIGVDIESKTPVGPRPCLQTSIHLPQFTLTRCRSPAEVIQKGYYPIFDRLDRIDGRAHTASRRNLDPIVLLESFNKLCDRRYDLSLIIRICNTVGWRQKYRGFADSNLFL